MRVRRATVATLALGVLLVSPSTASAVTITVDTESDSLSGGVCSLREATLAAGQNTASGSCPAGSASDPDTIVIPAGFYAVQFDGPNDDNGTLGDFDLNGAVTLRGAGAASTTISGMQLDRVIDVRTGTATVENVTLTAGHPVDGFRGISATGSAATGSGPGGVAFGGSGGGGADGGGVRVASSAELDLIRSVVTGNSSGNGGDGGFAVGGDGGDGTTGGAGGNASGGGGARGGDGGGIANFGTLVVTDSEIVGNATGPGGGGGGAFGGSGGSGSATGGAGGTGAGGFGARGGNGGGGSSPGPAPPAVRRTRLAAHPAR